MIEKTKSELNTKKAPLTDLLSVCKTAMSDLAKSELALQKASQQTECAAGGIFEAVAQHAKTTQIPRWETGNDQDFSSMQFGAPFVVKRTEEAFK